MQKTITLPNKNKELTSIEIENSLIIIGANGSGKTRLGTWIEISSPQSEIVHRISAQKSLRMPDTSTPQSMDIAENSLLYGNPDWRPEHKIHKWDRKPAIHPQNDYEKLMIYLFSEETDQNAKYKALVKAVSHRVEPPKTKMDIVKEVWEKILPHRILDIGGLSIKTKLRSDENISYKSSEMSDGERVIFYLIGQCLATPANGIIVIDEPELHLHKSIQYTLWNELEKQRQDCIFIYLTHDVDFASSKEQSKHIWVKSFDGETWDWELIEKSDGFPEDLLLEIIGSRQPILFVEGDKDSHDVAFYREIFKNFLVVPRGSCLNVISSTKVLQNHKNFIGREIYGLIDRDRRVDKEISELEKNNIYTLCVAEVESLFCTHEVIKLVSEKLYRNPEEDFLRVSNAIFKRIKSELEFQTSLRTSSEIKFFLSNFDESKRSKEEIISHLNELFDKIDVNDIYSKFYETLNSIIDSKEYNDLLKFYNRKTLTIQVAEVFGFKSEEYKLFVLRLCKSGEIAKIASDLKKYFGNFSSFIA